MTPIEPNLPLRSPGTDISRLLPQPVSGDAVSPDDDLKRGSDQDVRAFTMQ